MFPPMDVHAPASPDWTAALIKGSIPNIPVNAAQLPNPNWSNDVRSCGPGKVWSLSFDDGPSPSTHLVLDALRERNIKATFFVVGSRVVENPDILKRVYDEGHVIGLHTWSHPYLTTLSTDQIVSEIVYSAQAIKNVIGTVPRFMRPPYVCFLSNSRVTLTIVSEPS